MGAIGILLLVTSLALTQGRPDDLARPEQLWEPHTSCEGSDSVLIPHEWACNKYYTCQQGWKLTEPLECASGTHFSFAEQGCVHPGIARCTLPDVPTVGEPSTTGAPVVEGEEDCEDLPNGCPSDFEVYRLLPHETECNKFYYCNFGEKVERDCAPGTYFNATIEVCDWAENVGCAGSSGSGGETLDNGCPADFGIHQLLPHESDCSKFYYCEFGELTERDCPAGLHFSTTIQVCDWPANAGCEASGGGCTGCPNPDSGENGSGGDGSGGDGSGGDGSGGDGSGGDGSGGDGSGGDDGGGGGCTGCPNPESGENGSGGDGSGGDGSGGDGSSEGGCTGCPNPDSGENGSGCDEGGILENGCPSNFSIHQLLPHESDCSKFYYCVFGELIERVCPAGLHFSPTLQVCDWPASAGCESGGGGCTGCPNPESGENGSGVDEGSLENGCPSDFTIHKLLPHESDCSKFYYCIFGDVIERDCPEGLHFNATAEVCDWPWRAGCETGEGCTGGGGGCSTSTTPGGGDDGTTTSSPGGGDDGTTTTSPGGGDDGTTTSSPDGGDDGTTTSSPGDGEDGTTTSSPGGGDDGTTTSSPGGGDDGTTTSSPGGGDDGTTTSSPGGGDDGTTTSSPGGGDDGTTTTPSGGDDGTTTSSPGGGDDSTTTSSPGGGDDGTTTPSSDGGEGASTTTTPEGGEDCTTETPDARCEGDCNIAPFPHDDCDKYWRCEGDRAVLVVCSEGLHFNPVTYTCDFICYAGCVRETVQTTNDRYGVRVYLPWNTINNNRHAKELIELSKKSDL